MRGTGEWLPCRVHILVYAYERKALKRAIRVNLNGTDACFASVEDLIIHKISAGRPRDLEDIRGILLKNTNLDLTCLRDWLKEFDRIRGRSIL